MKVSLNLGANLAVNDGASNPRDLNANNSPSLVRNPLESGNLVVTNRVDSPSYTCGLHVSQDGGARWSSLEIPIPRGEQPKCFAPDVTFASDGTLLWQRSWGGNGFAQSVAVAPDGAVYVTGSTRSGSFGDQDLFVTRLSSDGTLTWSKSWGTHAGR